MSARPRFRLVPIEELREHEEIEPRKVQELVDDLRHSHTIADPIWVASGSGVILNGHHRVAALRHLGAARVPAWVFDYASGVIVLERWNEGPPIPKTEVERRATRGELYPPKTTRHIVRVELPRHPTPLARLLPTTPGTPRTPQRRASRSPRRRAASGPGAT